MITRGTIQAAEAQHAVQQYQSKTLAHYSTRQKEGQIVYLKSSDSEQFITLANLQPNFINIGDSLGLNSSDFYYQVKSFKCANRFYNILPGDSIYIRSRIGWSVTQNGQNTKVITGTLDDPYIKIDFNIYNERRMMTSTEIVDAVNERIRNIMIDIFGRSSQASVQEINLANVFSMGLFQYSQDSGKMEFETNTTAGYVIELQPSWYLQGLQNVCARQFILDLKIGQEYKNYDQVRLGRMFGLVPYIDQTEDYITDPNTALDGLTIVACQVDVFIEADAPSKLIKDYSPQAYPNIPDYRGKLLGQPLTFKGACPAPMQIYPYRQIYIRSSLQTNLWQHDGRRSNVIAIIPISGGLTSQIIQYEPPGSSQRTYNVKDSLNSLQSFSIKITDEFNQPIDFTEDYEIQVAIFFQPPDPMLQSM